MTLTAIAETGYVFAGWLGCKPTGTETCEVDVTAASEVTAVFPKEGKEGSEGLRGEVGARGQAGEGGVSGLMGSSAQQGEPGKAGREAPSVRPA